MKALFVVTGVGYGDSTREHANIKELLKKYPKARIIVAGYDNSYKYFRGKFPVIKIGGYRIPGKRMKFNVLPFIFYNYFLPFIWFFSAFKIKRAVKEFKPDIVISDFEPTGIPLARLVGKECVIVFGYDPALYKEYVKKEKVSIKARLEAFYFEQIYKRADHVIIPTVFPKKSKGKYHRVNVTIRKKPSSFDSKKKLMKKLGLEREPILVMLGGSDFGLALAKEIKNLAVRHDEDFLIFGGSKTIRNSKNVKHYKFKENILEYMKVCKGVITLAGQKTIAESIMFKKPLLILPIKHHIEQELNAYSMRKYALVGKDLKDLPRLLLEFLNNLEGFRKKVNKIKIKGEGSRETINIIQKILQH